MENSTSKCYDEKTKLVNTQDPYLIPDSEFATDPKTFPFLQYGDIVNYFVFTKSAYKMEEFISYKTLDGYRQFVSGLVSSLAAMPIEGSDRTLLKAKVKHKESKNQAPLLPWVVAKEEGTILTAHCTCVAGHTETCSHVCAMLFAVDEIVRWIYENSDTQENVGCAHSADTEMLPAMSIQEMNFKSKEKIPLPKVPEPTEAEFEKFLNDLKSAPHMPAIFSVHPNFVDYYLQGK